MALGFTAASSERLTYSGSMPGIFGATAEEHSLYVEIYPTSGMGAVGNAIWIWNESSVQGSFIYWYTSGTSKIFYHIYGSSGNTYGGTTTTTLNQWYRVLGRRAGDASHNLWFEGASRWTSSTNIGGLATPDAIGIGAYNDSGWTDYFNGYIGQIALWNVYLSDAEAAQLTRTRTSVGVGVRNIRPQNMTLYWKNTKVPSYESVRGLPMTSNGTIDVVDSISTSFESGVHLIPTAAAGVTVPLLDGSGLRGGLQGITGGLA